MAIPELKIAAWQFLFLPDWSIQWPIRPFWRLYWNDAPGATLSCDGETFSLEPEQVVILPPYSFFSSQLVRPVNHFFIHFMTGPRFADLERRVALLPVPEMLHTIIRSDDPAERQELRLFALLLRCWPNCRAAATPSNGRAWTPGFRRRSAVWIPCRAICAPTGKSPANSAWA